MNTQSLTAESVVPDVNTWIILPIVFGLMALTIFGLTRGALAKR